MAKKTSMNFADAELKAMTDVYAALQGLTPDAQERVLDYVARRFGVTSATSKDVSAVRGTFDEPVARSEAVAGQMEETGGLEGISPIAAKWMRRNELTAGRLSELYTLGVEEIDLVAKKVPGGSSRERLRNVMLLLGVASYLSSGAPRISNEKLKEAENHYDADAGGNFTKYLKAWASEISGARSGGDLTLTTRGLNAAKDLIKQMTLPKAEVA